MIGLGGKYRTSAENLSFCPEMSGWLRLAYRGTLARKPPPLQTGNMRIVANAFVVSVLLAGSAAAAWQELFNGRDLDGWDLQTKTNWSVRDGAIVVDRGQKGLLTSRGTYRDCELELEFRAEPGTESGVFLSSPKTVTDPGSECYEVNIAPGADAYPTGSLTGRSRHAGAGDVAGWRRLRVKVEGGKVEVWLDGERIVEYQDRSPRGWGHIGLEFDQGRVEFRSLRINKLDLP